MLVNNFFIRCCLKNLTHQANPRSPSAFSASNQIPIGHVLTELLKIFLPEVGGFFQMSVIVVVVVSRDSPPCIIKQEMESCVLEKSVLYMSPLHYPRLGQYSFRELMIVIATGLTLPSPLFVISTMFMWKSSQWFGKNIVRRILLTELQESMERCTGRHDIIERLSKTV